MSGAYRQDLNWLVTEFTTRVEDVAHAIVVSADGVPLALSAGIPTIAVEQFSELFMRMKKHLARVEHAMGVLMVITGIGFLTGAVSNVSIWLLETFPALQTIG